MRIANSIRAALVAALLSSPATVLAQSTPPAPNPAAPVKQAPPAKTPQPKTQAEYDAYKAAASLSDPAKLEAAATDFAEKFPDSELRSILFQQAMALYQQANDPGKTLEMARDALKYDPGNAVVLLTAAQVLADRTHDSDLDRDDRLAEASADARSALQNAGSIAPPADLTPEQFAAALAEIRGTAHEVLATIAFMKQDYSTAIQEYNNAAAEEKERTDAVVWLRLSIAHEKNGDYAMAAAIVQKAIEASAPGSQIRQLAEQEQSHLEKLASAAKGGAK